MTDTSKDETVVVDDSKTKVQPDATPTVTPEVKSTDTGEADRLRKELEQAKMRENQLANQLKAKEQLEEEAQRKQLEDKEEFKNLYEQEKAKREDIESNLEKENTQKELDKATSELFAGYSDEVKVLAKEAGMALTDVSEEAQADFKARLDKVDSLVVKTTTSPNNPGKTGKTELSGDDLKRALKDEGSFHTLIMDKYPGIANMTKRR